MPSIWDEFASSLAAARAARGWGFADLSQAAFGNPDHKLLAFQAEQGRAVLHLGSLRKLAVALDLPDSVTDPVYQSDLPEQDVVTETDRNAAALIRRAEADPDLTLPAEALLLTLAQDFAGSRFADLDTAYAGLGAALVNAADLRAIATLAEGSADPMLAVAARLADLNDLGQRTAAAAAIEAALASLTPDQILHKAALTDIALRQDRICNAPDRAAKRLLAEIKSVPHPGGLFKALHDKWEQWFDRGAEHGLTFDLTTALHLARANLERSKAVQRSQAMVDLGITQFRLGEVEGRAQRLAQAVATFRAFLAYHPRKSDPDTWAVARVNLGVALVALARIEPATTVLEEAIAAFKSALTVQTQAHAPQDWAATTAYLEGAQALLAGTPAQP